jgi:hypothetical protein
MTRVSAIVTMWLLLTGGVGDAVLQGGGGSRLALLLFHGAASALTALALWVELAREDRPARRWPPPRYRRAYD